MIKYKIISSGRLALYILGCILFSLGAKCFIDSHLGVDPLDAMILGIKNYIDLKIGTISSLIAILFLLVWSVWNKRLPILTPFITMSFVGYLIDLWNYLDIIHASILASISPYSLMVLALIICSYASSLIIMSGIGIRTMDLVAITMVNKLTIPFYLSKSIIEVAFIMIGYFLDGPVGLGTLAFLCLVGPLIQPFMYLNNKLMGLTNYGMSKEVDTQLI